MSATKFIIESKNHDIKVLTYNVSWESLESSKSLKLDMSHCALNNKSNECSDNIAQIICQYGINLITNTNTNTNKYIYDFICLQEIINTKNQWKYLENKINQLEPDFLSNYNIEYTEDLPAGIISLYNKNYYHLIYKFQGQLSNHDHRPWQILVFKEKIILINVHFPHLTYFQEDSLYIIKTNIEKIKNLLNLENLLDWKIIFCGDFNNQDPTQLQNFPFIFQSLNMQLYKEPKKLITCCVPHDFSTYNKSSDHIYSSFAQASLYETMDDKKYFIKGDLRIMSDHLPVFAIFPIDNDNFIKKYYINYLK